VKSCQVRNLLQVFFRAQPDGWHSAV
jgi:hypothetical protein